MLMSAIRGIENARGECWLVKNANVDVGPRERYHDVISRVGWDARLVGRYLNANAGLTPMPPFGIVSVVGNLSVYCFPAVKSSARDALPVRVVAWCRVIMMILSLRKG